MGNGTKEGSKFLLLYQYGNVSILHTIGYWSVGMEFLQTERCLFGRKVSFLQRNKAKENRAELAKRCCGKRSPN
jgi:hypothetical protein